MSTTRQDNAGSPVEVEQVPGQKWVDASTSIVSTTTRTDRGSEGDEPTVAEVSMTIHQPSKRLA